MRTLLPPQSRILFSSDHNQVDFLISFQSKQSLEQLTFLDLLLQFDGVRGLLLDVCSGLLVFLKLDKEKNYQ